MVTFDNRKSPLVLQPLSHPSPVNGGRCRRRMGEREMCEKCNLTVIFIIESSAVFMNISE
jgi:hypothetical protein